MSKYKCHLLIVALFLIALSKGESLFKCYKCTSLVNQACKDPFNITQLVLTEDCNYDYQVCLKQEIPAAYYMVEDEIKRGCVNEDYCFAEEKRSTHCSTCRSYLCNSVINIHPKIILIFILSMFCIY